MATSQSPPVVVEVLGRHIPISKNKDVTRMRLEEVRLLLQEELDMEGRLFELFDSCGSHLRTDDSFSDAIERGRFPFTAMLADTSVHFLEAKQQALQQMQFKMLHEPASKSRSTSSLHLLSGSTDKSYLGNVSTNSSLNSTFQVNGDSSLERARRPSVNSQRTNPSSDADQCRQEIRQLQERLTAREAADLQLTRLVTSLREAIDSSTRSSSALVVQQDTLRTRLDAESSQHTVVENQLAQELQSLTARVDDLSEALHRIREDCQKLSQLSSSSACNSDSTSRIESAENQCKSLQSHFLQQQREVNEAIDNLNVRTDRVALEVQHIRSDESMLSQLRVLHSELAQVKELHAHTAENLRQSADQVLGEANNRFELFNDCCTSLHSKCLEQQRRLDNDVERLNDKLQGMTNSVEEVLKSDKLKEEFSLLSRLKDIEQSCVNAHRAVRETCDAERRTREEEMKNWRAALLASYGEHSRRSSHPQQMMQTSDRSGSEMSFAKVQQLYRERAGDVARMKERLEYDRRSQASHTSADQREMCHREVDDGVQLLWDEKPAESSKLSDISPDQMRTFSKTSQAEPSNFSQAPYPKEAANRGASVEAMRSGLRSGGSSPLGGRLNGRPLQKLNPTDFQFMSNTSPMGLRTLSPMRVTSGPSPSMEESRCNLVLMPRRALSPSSDLSSTTRSAAAPAGQRSRVPRSTSPQPAGLQGS